MCGIAGFISFSMDRVDSDEVLLERMADALRHRGPDSGGCLGVEAGSGSLRAWGGGERGGSNVLLQAGLANRRLRIIDLSPAGHQPMCNEDGTVWLVHNGEVYNYRELRTDLEGRGHRFRSQTDTEVIIHAYEEYGPACVREFNGMWAFAIYDRRDGSLLLARDRFGVKPLYIYRDGLRLVFASEIKSLLLHPAVPKAPNYRTVYNYAARNYRWVDGGRETFFDGIEQVLPAHALHVSASGQAAEERYWALDPSRRLSPDSDETAIRQFRDLFADAVRLRLRSDVPLACTLSGGLDSTSVTCMAAKLTGAPVTTFSARYDGGPYDEGPFIQATVDHIHADGRSIYPGAGDLFETLDTMLSYHDEPVCTVTWYAHWLVMREVARHGFPVLLNGHAGDELLAGYWDHYHWNFADLRAAGDTEGLAHELECWQTLHRRDPGEIDRYVELASRLESGSTTRAAEGSLYADCIAPDFRARYETTPERPGGYTGHLDQRLQQELTYETVPATLRPEDRNSMAFSIESRTPFLDYRLVEFCFSLPNRFKIRDGIGKWLLRQAMEGILPDVVRLRREKVGFNAPSADWFRTENQAQIRSLLLSSSCANRGIFHMPAVRDTLEQHLAGTANHYHAIWQWINLELWFRRFIDQELR